MTTNIEKLINKGGNCGLFAETVRSLSKSQGFYERLCKDINELDDDSMSNLIQELSKQQFKDAVDVILWLEN